MNKYKTSFSSELSLPEVPPSIIFSPHNPFSLENICENTSENVEEENFELLAMRLNSTIMQQKKQDYFNKKIYDFNDNKKNNGFLSEEFRSNNRSYSQVSAKSQISNESLLSVKSREKYQKKNYALSEETQESGFLTQKNQLINDTFDFLKKMQAYDMLEDEFLTDERQEFEKNEDYMIFLDEIVREETLSQKNCLNKLSVNMKKANSSNTENRVAFNFTKELKIQTEKIDNYQKLLDSIYNGNIQNIKLAIKNVNQIELNKCNSEGQTPLLLYMKLARTNPNYAEIIKLLLMSGANPKIKDKNSWGPLDEAITQSNVKVTLYLFDYLSMLKKEFFREEKMRIIDMLGKLPDFDLEMKWDFESSVIPLLGKLAPSDTFRIRKYKSSLRMDYSLVGIKNLKAKKREMSLLFNPINDVSQRKDVKEFDTGKGIELFWLLNRSKNNFTNPLQEIDFYEKKTILYDLMTSQAFEGNMNIIKCDFNESYNWIGKKITQKIGSWQTRKFDFLLTYEYTFNKKEKIPVDNSKISSSSRKTSREEKSNELNFLKKIDNMSYSLPNKKEKKIKRNAASIWITEDFPLKFKELLPLFNFLSTGNSMMNKLNIVLQNQKIQEVVSSNGFPIKIQIPINFTIRANIGFLKFQFLTKNEDFSNFFEIPSTMPYCDRKLAQKILTRTKKRMVLTNALI